MTWQVFKLSASVNQATWSVIVSGKNIRVIGKTKDMFFGLLKLPFFAWNFFGNGKVIVDEAVKAIDMKQIFWFLKV